MGKVKPAAVRITKPRWMENYFVTVLLAILFGAALIYILRNPQYRTGSFNDDAIYVIGARDFWRPAALRSPLLKPDYPFPGLPLLVSPFALLVSSHWIALESLTIVFTILLIGAMALWSRRFLSAGESLAATALLAFNPVIARLSGSIMAAIYYAFTVVASLYLISAWKERPTKAKALALGLLLGWGSLVRPEGAILTFAVVMALLIHASGRRLLAWAAIPLAGWGLFAWYWFRIRVFPSSEYAGDLSALAAYWSTHFRHGVPFTVSLLNNVINNALLSSKLTRSLSSMTNHAMTLCCIAVTAVGFLRLWRERRRERDGLLAAALFCVLYLGIHVFWHADAPRYAIPLLPFLMLFAVGGAQTLLARVKGRTLLLQGALAVVLVFDLYRNGLSIYNFNTHPNLRNSPPWQSLAWVRDHLPNDGLIMSNIAPSIDLYTQRPTINGIYSDNLDWLTYRLMTEHLAFLVLRAGDFITPGVEGAQDPNHLWDRIQHWAIAYPQRFELLHQDAAEETSVYRIVSDPNYVRAYALFQQAVVRYRQDPADHDGQAMRLLNAALAIYPRLGSAYNFLGGIDLNRGDGHAAGLAFLKAVDCLPDDPYAMMNLATIYRMAGRPDQAQAYAQRVLDLAAKNGTQDVWSAAVQQMYRDWNAKRLRLYLDAPIAETIPITN